MAAKSTIGLALLAASALAAAPASAEPDATLARGLLGELVAVNTAPSGGSDTREAVRLIAARLREAGFAEKDITVLGKTEKLQNLVVRYRVAQPKAKPVLMMAHLDVVEARPEDWSVPPFRMTGKDGYLYGRGTSDNKGGAAILIANFIQLKREGFVPDRDLIVMLTADEESEGAEANFLATEHRDLIDADYALNTDGGLVILGDDGKARAFSMQTAEKVYVSYALTATDPGGHSSVPKADSPISQLARALVALEAYDFPIDLNETSRAFFQKWSAVAPPEHRPLLDAISASENGSSGPPQLVQVPYYNALARTTCVATQLEGGHAENALPQSARAVVNCRVLPQESTDDVEAQLRALAQPHHVTVERITSVNPSPPSPLRADVVGPVTAIAERFWPGIPVIPELSTGATDGAFVRRVGIPVYGVGAIAENPGDIRAHGKDERVSIAAFDDALGYWYDLTKAIAGGK